MLMAPIGAGIYKLIFAIGIGLYTGRRGYKVMNKLQQGKRSQQKDVS